MAEKLDPKEIVSLEEAMLAQVIEQEALVNILVKKKLIKEEELLEEIERLKEKYLK